MNDLIIPTKFEESFPTTIEGLKKAWNIFNEIKSFEDIERVFLYGNGLSPKTYKRYLITVKQFYEFTNGKHPLQATCSDIEAFYDYLCKRVDRNTAYIAIRGLKKFFEGIRHVISIYTSPFEVMSEQLKKKLNRTKKGNRTKKALTGTEVRALLAWLMSESKDVKRVEDYAIFFMLVTSGLRADELIQLKWKNLECFEGKWTAYFIGKGGKEAEQELYSPAVEACIKYFKKAFHRDPRPDDAVFWTLPSYNGDESRPMPYHTLWKRIVHIGENAREQGIIKRDLQFTPHLMRRSYATNLYKAGMGIKAIQEKTRHASVDTLMKHYVHDEDLAAPYLTKILM